MLSPGLVAGIDAGKHFLDLGFHPAGKPMRCDNNPAGIKRLIAALRQRGVIRVALEAIGPYAQPLVHALVAAGFTVALIDPRRVKAFRTAEGLIAKTDRLDAALIARFAHRMSESLRPVPTADQVTLKALSTRRRQLTELIAMEKTRLAQALDPMIVDSHRAVLEALTRTCAEVEAELDRRIAADPALARKRIILTSIPGIGRRIAGVLITDMPELGRLDRKAAASLAGMAPHPSQSGAHPGRHAIAGGRPCLRTAFYMAGMVAARACPAFRKPYRAMRDAGKPAKLAIVATGRRVVTLANALLRANKTFDQSDLVTCQATSGTAPLATTGQHQHALA
ncbi:transposase IS116/IS110/IS902 family protein [Methylobacterium sp. 4-46]|uniref:IS110-like element ISMtsp9 family transposase n=1 Tax=unclassified Methylobacterium TaxID=2615210 RepID=UPI000152DA01|nr:MULTISPECIES: IS110-like element ISMtsp9 family transposase [Methylobacterium]ACA16960.1 transposase IS116/IS110/IS902 family protein [Methylobacterium sp. 4-46]ACA18377.1 transposase IS116/IS110/IS902 family protein [Methylobacterium sp. 4-46]ACA19859.1 transposase IS116/IS110/IS902 family protein [Methylobacterium sp. 4-46]WFT77669.1 IS110-like element ISMtsp9 family transposase [Methylobacterium nodulans]WFT79042.1 IS110-like element ISMtsp9 family transposase [Methylobacterium nodulans]